MLDDPLGIDRRLRETARSWQAFRTALRAGAGDEHAFEHLGRYASRELVLRLSDAGPNDPLAPSLLRWAYRLHEEHALAELAVAHAAAVRRERHPLDAPERGNFTLREMLEHALMNTKGARRLWLEMLTRHASTATDLALRRLERRAELAAEFDAAFVERVELPGEHAVPAASNWLAATDDAFRELDRRDLSGLIESALGADSQAGWPAHLNARSLGELFRDARWLEGISFELRPLPRPLGAASFLRALFALGSAWRGAWSSSAAPFTLAHDAYGLERATLGALVALVPFGESFARRELDVSRAGFRDHLRVVARAWLIGTREAAFRAHLLAPSLAGRRVLHEAYAEVGHRALRVDLDPRALGVLFTPRPGDVQRFAGLLLAADLDARLTSSHDEDWYRNPRAVEELRETARQAPETNATEVKLGSGALSLQRSLIDALG